MPGVGLAISPLLVGRDDLLDLADRRIGEVAAGNGRLLLVSGEAGIGKTRFAGAVIKHARERDFRIAQGSVSPQDQGLPAASFLDLARNVARSSEFGDLGIRLSGAVETVLGAADPSRRRLVHDLGEMLVDAVETPTVIRLADLQWADELSLELLTDLARASRERPLLLLVDFRTDEPGRNSLLREWRSRVVTQRLGEEVRLRRLSLDETALVTTLILATGLPAPRDVVAAVYQRTDGVPLHIEELLGALAAEETANGRAVLQAAVPETLEDATLARVARLSPIAQSTARAGAVFGQRFVPDVLATILDLAPEDIDAPVEELVDHRILDGPDPAGAYDFHHQLLRDALYGSVPLRERRAIHARAAELAAAGGESVIQASLHFERAGMTRRAFETAVAGAEAAAALPAHRDAAALYERAVRNLPHDLETVEAARVYEAYGRELAAIDANVEAAASLTEAGRRYREAGDLLASASIQAPLSSIRHLLGDGVEVLEPMLCAALNDVEGVEESPERDRARAQLLAALAISYTLALHVEDAEARAMEAIELARATGDEPTEITGLTTLANALPFMGRIREGLETGELALGRARRANLDDHAARVHRWLGAGMSEVFEFGLSERWLREGIELSDRTDLWNHQNYMTAHLGYVLWATGRWAEATDAAQRAEADGRGGVTTELAARYVQGYVLVGRGNVADGQVKLRESLALAERLGEVLRLAFPLWGLAEAALLTGDVASAIELTERARGASESVGDAAMLIPSIVTGTRARLAARDPAAAGAWLEHCTTAVTLRRIPAGEVALEHGRGLLLSAEGSLGAAREALRNARAGWDERNRAWEAAWVRLDLGRCLQRMNRWGEAAAVVAEARSRAHHLGSAPILAAADELERRTRGRGIDAAPWRPLTTREFEVARLIAAGMTNAELASELSISPKTASAHVEHILAKLGVSRRAEIASWAATVAPHLTAATLRDQGQERVTT